MTDRGGDPRATAAGAQAPAAGDPANGTGAGSTVDTADEIPSAGTATEEDSLSQDDDRPPPAGELSNVAAAVVGAAIGVAGAIGSFQLGLGSPGKPGPGMWPFIISLVVAVLSVALALFGRKTLDGEKFSRSSWSVLAGLATMIGFVVVLGVIGFEVPTLLLTFVWLKFLGRESWRMSVVLSVAITAAFYAIFVGALGVPIPHLF